MDGLSLALARSSDAKLRSGNHLKLFENGPDTYDDWLVRIAGLLGVLGVIRSYNSTEPEEVLSIPVRVRRELRDRSGN